MKLLFIFLAICTGYGLESRLEGAPVSEASPEQGRLYGTLQTSPGHAALERDKGLRVAVIAVSWDKLEPKPGVFDETYAAQILLSKQTFRKLGYKLQIDMGVQYPPAWVFQLPNGHYMNQFGAQFTSGQPGENLPNVVFNSAVRQQLAAYFKEVFARLGTDWDYVRLGCSKYGELNYPRHKFADHENCYWAFDDIAQGKVAGLPAGISACPVPGWIPGTPSSQHAKARAFAEWYLDCLKNYQDWQIATVRKWYSGDLCMLYGSWGVRPGWLDEAVAGDLNGSTSPERNGEIQQGFDWTRMIGGINDPHVIVYCTWVDGTLKNRDISDDDGADSAHWSPVHWQSSLASANPLKLRVWGENTGGNNPAAMRLAFQKVKRFGLMGLMWAFDRELFANPNPEGFATFADYLQCIHDEQ